MRTVASEDEDDGTLRHFVLKREYAEGSIMMAMGKFPAAALPEPGQPAPMMYRLCLPAACQALLSHKCAPDLLSA